MAVESVQNAIARLDIRHPVIHDPDLQLWKAYGVGGWPTLVFIDPQGRVLGDLPGEPEADRLIDGVGEMLRCWGKRRCVRPEPIAVVPFSPSYPFANRFRFPAKIKPLNRAGHDRFWAVADSGHHQVVVCTDSGAELRRFGCGEPGFLDLDGGSAAFNAPQGLACDDPFIYVADTGNHAIRRIDLTSGHVCTIAGTGQRGCILGRRHPGPETQLASVWDIECCNGMLYFANAGTHQLGCVDLSSLEVSALAGTGREDLVDGVPEEAQLAQPTGLAFDASTDILYFVDSETSSVRALSLHEGSVRTLVGAGLFESGRRNGNFASARLQHCRGLAVWRDRLVVADTYNGVLRVLDLKRQQVSELAGAECRWANGLRLAGGEPSGVAADGDDRLLVADTNHHRLVEVTVSGDRPSARVWAA